MYTLSALQPEGLLCPPYIVFCSHFCSQRSLRVLHDTRTPSSERWNYLWVRKLTGKFCLEMPTSTIHSRVLLHAVNLRHGTEGFTSLPKEGVLRNFFALKNPTASAVQHSIFFFIWQFQQQMQRTHFSVSTSKMYTLTCHNIILHMRGLSCPPFINPFLTSRSPG